MLWVMENYDQVDPIILSVGEEDEISIGEAAEFVAKAFTESCGIAVKLEYDPSFSDGQFKKTASNEKLRKLRPDFKFTEMKSGIADTVQWYVTNYETARK